MRRAADLLPATIDEQDRSIEVVWSTGSRVRRQPLFGEPFDEELSMDPGSVRLDRLNAGGPRVDIIISDINMPQMDGITFVKHARELPAVRTVPILMLTTESMKELRQQAKAAGATGWIVKPFNAAQLITVVKDLLP